MTKEGAFWKDLCWCAFFKAYRKAGVRSTLRLTFIRYYSKLPFPSEGSKMDISFPVAGIAAGFFPGNFCVPGCWD